jgi:hypothetical protein
MKSPKSPWKSPWRIGEEKEPSEAKSQKNRMIKRTKNRVKSRPLRAFCRIGPICEPIPPWLIGCAPRFDSPICRRCTLCFLEPDARMRGFVSLFRGVVLGQAASPIANLSDRAQVATTASSHPIECGIGSLGTTLGGGTFTPRGAQRPEHQ